MLFVFFVKQKTAYEMRISDWSSDVCSSDLGDRAAIRWHDVGLRLVRNDAGEDGFEVYAGGGMGRTPFIAELIRAFCPADRLFSYCQAILRVWNRHARRDRKSTRLNSSH